ncbi:MAG: MFS transporter, partial [Chloroflexi bacterium]|nr:MFS transporter [Chloroflexota bacterium]
LVITVWSFVSLGTSLIGGLIADRFPVRFALGAAYVGLALAALLLINVNGVATAFLFAVLYGAIFGMVNIFVHVIFQEYYGRGSLGAIRGVATLVQMLGNASGPLVAALAYDATGSYTLIFSVFVGLYVVGGIALFLAPTPQRVRAELEARAARG